MWYLIEQFGWDDSKGLKYYHLIDSNIVESDEELHSYYKDGVLYDISITEANETKRRSKKGRNE